MSATANTTRVAPLKAQAFYSFTVTIPDDEAYSFTPSGSYGHIFISSSSNSAHGVAWFRTTQAISIASGSNFNVSADALNGTTGADGKLTLGANGGVLYVENRMGTSQTYVVTILSFNGATE